MSDIVGGASIRLIQYLSERRDFSYTRAKCSYMRRQRERKASCLSIVNSDQTFTNKKQLERLIIG